MAKAEQIELRNDEINQGTGVRLFALFPKVLPHVTQHFRLGLVLATFQTSFNLNIPYLLTIALFSGKRVQKAAQPMPPKTSRHIREIRLGNRIRLGVDAYLAELGFVIPLFKLWLKLEPLGQPFKKRKLFSFFYILFKASIFEVMFHVRLFGLGLGLHIPFYEIPWVKKIKQERERKFWDNYRKQKSPTSPA